MPDTIEKERFAQGYQTRPPWDIDGPQPAFAALSLSGTLLDAGCGSGEIALHFASRGVAVTGIDFVEAPIAQALAKAKHRGLRARFLVKDALTLSAWDERFDNVVDSGLMHVFSDEDRARYLAGVHHVLRPGGRFHLQCFSDATPGEAGPRRVRKAELEDAFARDWALESVTPVLFEIRDDARIALFAGEKPRAWFAVARRI